MLRRTGAVLSLLAAALMVAGPAAAHTGEASVVSGSMELDPGESKGLGIDGMLPSDTLEWNWSSNGTNVTAVVVWRDTGGATHRVAGDGRPVGRFLAPGNLSSGSLEWTNGGANRTTVEWNFVCSSDFWSQPLMIAAAAIPFILLAVALGAGRVVDRRAHQRTAEQSKERGNGER